MYKIINIDNDIVYIGSDDGSFQEVRLVDCAFKPNIGDLVNVFSNEFKTIVTKIEEPKPVAPIQDKIHINIVNENKNNESQAVNTQSLSQSGKVVNKVVYCVLALFLGAFGFHKFYAEKFGQGILYLIFCWTYIPAIISLIEFIVALTKSSDAQGNIVV